MSISAKLPILLLGAVLAGTILSFNSYANPADYIYTTAVESGEREIDFKAGSASPQDGSGAQGISVGYGYAAKENWFTEVYLKQERNGGNNTNFAEWENKFQLTQTGQYAVDMGFITEVEAPLSNNAPWELNIGPLFQTEWGKFQLNGNLLFQRAFGKTDESGAPYTTNLNYQWQAKYRWQPILEIGLQGFGELGKWNDWNSRATQSHRIGPALFGKIPLGNRQAIRYNTAWLIGASTSTPGHTIRLQIEYEF